MSTAEATMKLTAQDHASAPLEKIQERFKALLAPIERLKLSLNGISGGGLAHVGSALDGVKGKLAAIGIGAGVAVTGVMAIKGAIAAVSETAEKAYDIRNLAARFHVGTDELQVMSKIAKEAGVSVEGIAGAYSQLQRRMGDAMGDPEKAQKLNNVFQEMGMTLKQAQAMKSTDLFIEIGKNFAKATGVQIKGVVQDEIDQATQLKESIAKNLFSKAGVADMAVIEKFSTDYKDTLSGMIEAGLLLNSNMIGMGAHAFESYKKSKGAMDGIKMMFGIEMMPVFDQFSQVMKDRMVANRTAMMPGVHALAGVLSTAIKPFLDDMDKMADKTSGLFKIISKFANLVGWDNLIFGTLALISLPFIASIAGVVISIYSVVAAMVATGVAAVSSFVPAMLSSGVAMVRTTALTVALNGGLGTMRLAFMAAAGGVRVMTLALLTNPIVLIVAGIAAAAYLLYKAWDGVSSFFKGIWDGISLGLDEIYVAFKPTLSWLGEIWTSIASALGLSATGVQDWSSAGVIACGALIFALKFVLTSVTLLIDAFHLLKAGWGLITGGDSSFTSATKALWSGNSETRAATLHERDVTKSKATLRGMENATLAADEQGGPNDGEAMIKAGKSAMASYGQGLVTPQKIDFGGKVDINIRSDGRVDVSGVASNNPNVKMTTNTGSMHR